MWMWTVALAFAHVPGAVSTNPSEPAPVHVSTDAAHASTPEIEREVLDPFSDRSGQTSSLLDAEVVLRSRNATEWSAPSPPTGAQDTGEPRSSSASFRERHQIVVIPSLNFTSARVTVSGRF